MKVFKGSEKKFAVELTCPGFDQNTNDFEVIMKSGNTEVHFYSNPNQGSPNLFTEEVEVPAEEEGGEPTNVTTWYGIVDTTLLAVGKVRAIGIAHVPDTEADVDAIRNEIDVQQNVFEIVEP